jgi:hypothetical protein
MKRVSSLVLSLVLIGSTIATTGCGTVPSQSSGDTAASDGPDYSWGSAGTSGTSSSSDDSDDDSDDTTDSGDTDSGSGLPETDSGETDSGVVTGPIEAWVYVYEDTVDTNVALYGIANASTGDYSEYSSAYASTSDGSKGNGWLKQPVTYTPGDVLSMNCAWSDGTANARYCAEAGALLTNVKYILVVFADGTYDQYDIGTTTSVGDAYIKDANGYHDWMIVTNDHTTGDYDL